MIARALQLSADKLVVALLRLDAARRVQILDSGGRRGDEARFLIAGCDPFEVIEARSSGLRIFGRNGTRSETCEAADVLNILDERLARYYVPPAESASSLPACGACIASFSYELAHSLPPQRAGRAPRPANPQAEPDAVLAFYDTLVIHDYARATSQVVSLADSPRLNQVWEAVNEAARLSQTQEGAHDERAAPAFDAQQDSTSQARFFNAFESTATSNFTREQYLSAIRQIQEHIAAGDIYQANLTQQLSVALDTRLNAERIFLNLRRDHPASFAAFLRRGEDIIVSASPERFLHVTHEEGERLIEAWPIKGTRPRGRDVAEDALLRAELQASEKDRAENVMIVDLLRNDLGRVCRYGTVNVPEMFVIQEHPSLFHLVSKVRGALRDDVTAGDILRAAFPCGSITGAPKIRAMEIIDALEPVARGLSMGAIGYFSFDGTLDLSVAIRTMTVRDGVARFNVGGGIVADSCPALEYEESLTKARALLRASGVGEAQHRQH